MTEPRNALVEGLFARHRTALQAFFFRRLRTKADAADLAQEVYLRILRVNDPDTIRNPQACIVSDGTNSPKADDGCQNARIVEAHKGRRKRKRRNLPVETSNPPTFPAASRVNSMNEAVLTVDALTLNASA